MNHLMVYNLQFFANDGPGGEKTEPATSKKLSDARKKGQVAKSVDLSTAVALLALFLLCKVMIGFVGSNLISSYQVLFGSISKVVAEGFDSNSAGYLFQYCLTQLLLIAGPFVLSAFIVAFVVNFIQVKWNISLEPLKPTFGKFNPVNGFKQMFSMNKVMDLLKTNAKLLVLGYIIYSTLKDQWSFILNFYKLDLISSIILIGNIVINLGLKISIFFFILAMADYMYQKRKFKKDMRMTKQEVKDEYKMTEGNPQIKSHIKRKMMQVSQRRMMQSLPEADVVITNPTHLAVAIKYDRDSSSAPVVIAKGADYLANKIKIAASENEIEIVENKPLARMLYFNVEIGQEIPPELYQMVAEILAYVYGLKGKI